MLYTSSMYDFLATLRRNILTPFVLIILVLVALLFLIDQRGDALFLGSTITLNSLLGIIQEIRARHMLYKLELLNAQTVHRLTEKGIEEIPLAAIREGDQLELYPGDQVPADGRILESRECRLDESLLSGESQEISKKMGDFVLAGSRVTGGSAIFQVIALGDQTRAGRIAKKLRKYSNRLTPLQRSLARILRYLTYLSALVIILIIIDGRASHSSIREIINTVVAGAVTLVPEGLVLASTLLYSYGTLNLARHQVLIQRLASLEGFGRLRYLCFDKTGTLTEAHLKIAQIIPLEPYSLRETKHLLAALVSAENHPSPTTQAILDAIPHYNPTITSQLPFTSSRKFSAIGITKDGDTQFLALGAPEILKKKTTLTVAMEKIIHQAALEGKRVLLALDLGSKADSLEDALEGHGHAFAIIVLASQLRPGIQDVVFYLQAQGVQLRVISGDALETVQQIARESGILHVEQAITGDELALLERKNWNETVRTTTIFARILPEQKEQIIATLCKYGFTGMVGDGVNDALALKKADLGIAMRDGSSATRLIADVVLLNNDFASFPIGMRLGSQIILGLEMVACIFFNKISYGLTIILLNIVLDGTFPFAPRHIVLLNLFTIGIPSLIWSIMPPQTAHRLDPDFFFPRVFRFTILNGILTGLAVIGSVFVSNLLGFYETQTLALLIAFTLGCFTFWLIPESLQAIQNQRLFTAQNIYLGIVILGGFLIIQSPLLRHFFGIAALTIPQTAIAILTLALVGWLQYMLSRKPITYALTGVAPAAATSN